MNPRNGPADQPPSPKPKSRRPKYVPVVGTRLKKLLAVVFALFALLVVNSVYLVAITVAGAQFQNWFYLIMFMVHLALGLLIVVPVILFGIFHIKNARNRPNKRAIRVGYALFVTAIILLGSGFVLLTRADGAIATHAPYLRSAAYWAHVICPLIAIWLFVLHRLAGRRIKWKVGVTWGAVAAGFAVIMLILQTQDPRAWNQVGPASGEQYFFPSLARTSTGNFIDADVLDNNEYCMGCHQEIHNSWVHSVHRFSSFNNPPYEFSVRGTRAAMMERDGNVQGSRFCAGCHDPVPFFSGAFDDPKFDDPNYDLANDPMAQAGITCTVCHAISHVNSPKGNADYTITEPVHYPFAFSDNAALQWINQQLIKAKPAFHKATFLKPLHQSAEFCGTCHKVHLPVELNDYKWLRGQNHFDAFWLSGVSGQGITSFYYPPKAETNCNGCHMPLTPVASTTNNFGARMRENADGDSILATLNHQFPSANTAIPHLVRDKIPDADAAIQAHKDFNKDVLRLDIFAIREGGTLEGELHAPLRPDLPTLQPGETYLVDTVIRTMKMGHVFTQGTSDSNEIWLDATITDGQGNIIARSGGMREPDNAVDPWSHYVNSFVLDREGNRINRRNAEDIFIALYSNQIPPGAADVVHGRFTLPPDVVGPVTISAKLQFRKFDTEYMRLVTGDEDYVNDLPIMTLAEDAVTLPVGDAETSVADGREIPLWQRWNDYGIGLLRKTGAGELRQARYAFEQVEQLGRADGPLNLARAYIREGNVQTDAPQALQRAATMDPPAYAWSLLWFGAQVAERNGDYDKVIENLRDILRGGFTQAEGRGFDFSKDYRVRNALGDALYQRALQETGDARTRLMQEAEAEYLAALSYDPENVNAHWGLKQVYRDLGNKEKETFHTAEHAKYRPDENARDYAVAQARIKYPAANKAAEAVVIYDWQRQGAYELPDDVADVALSAAPVEGP